MSYPFREIESRWQAFWEENESFHVTEEASVPREKRRYVLDMFPYPSAAGLHVGHPEGYTATDIFCRFLRMHGFSVLHPIGFDSFGLPAENYAIKTGTSPRLTTEANIAHFRKQIKSLGFSYDWTREISTHEPSFYRWTQWIFLQLYKKDLAYEAFALVNWCPSCMAVLANEEVKEGRCTRCSALVVRKEMRQWMLRITRYADALLEGLKDLNWPESVKQMQINWIGKSEGVRLIFQVVGSEATIEAYTTRPETIFGVTYLVLAPENPLVQTLASPELKGAIDLWLERVRRKSDLERTELDKNKEGMFIGAYVINPANGKEIPLWIGDYVLASYGSGAVMGVPAHDRRDFDFAKKHNLPLEFVIRPFGQEKKLPDSNENWEEVCFTSEGEMFHSGFLDGMSSIKAREATTQWLEAEKKGTKQIQYHLRDWIFSRQRYWGEPIPLIHCPDCKIVPVDEKDLPVLLPEVADYKPSPTGESPLALAEDWVNVPCPRCGKPSKRETNTMPQWAGSCWYYLRYTDPKNDHAFVDPAKESYWLPVDLYIGGAEHAVLHLLYARFWHKVLFDLGLVSTSEPFSRLVNQGMILGEGGIKMSKSLGNVINPDEIVAEYGADSMRLYEMFMGPLEISKPWSTHGLIGLHRFLNRVWDMVQKPLSCEKPPHSLVSLLHKTIKKVTHDTNSLSFNTAISQMMIFVNESMKEEKSYHDLLFPFVQLLSPYAPHIGEELGQLLGHKGLMSETKWPIYDESLTIDESVPIIVQINGKLRDSFFMPLGSEEPRLLDEALAREKIQEHLKDKKILKTIVVRDKLVNFVVGQ